MRPMRGVLGASTKMSPDDSINPPDSSIATASLSHPHRYRLCARNVTPTRSQPPFHAKFAARLLINPGRTWSGSPDRSTLEVHCGTAQGTGRHCKLATFNNRLPWSETRSGVQGQQPKKFDLCGFVMHTTLHNAYEVNWQTTAVASLNTAAQFSIDEQHRIVQPR